MWRERERVKGISWERTLRSLGDGIARLLFVFTLDTMPEVRVWTRNGRKGFVASMCLDLVHPAALVNSWHY